MPREKNIPFLIPSVPSEDEREGKRGVDAHATWSEDTAGCGDPAYNQRGTETPPTINASATGGPLVSMRAAPQGPSRPSEVLGGT